MYHVNIYKFCCWDLFPEMYVRIDQKAESSMRFAAVDMNAVWLSFDDDDAS